MATQFQEAGTDATFGFQFWTSNGGAGTAPASDSVVFNTGLRSIKFSSGTNGDSFVQKTLVMADAGRRVSFYFRMTDLPVTSDTAITALDINTSNDLTNIFRINITTAGVVRLVTGPSTVLGTGSTLSTGTWYRLCLSYVITSTTNYTVKLFVNGVLDISVSNSPTLAGTGTSLFYLGFLNGGGGSSKVWNIDDVYVDDSTALTDTGNIRVTAKLPNANNTNNFDTAIGANPVNRWTNVNERILSEVNGWQHAATSNVVENFGIENAATGDVNISTRPLIARTAWVWAKKGAGGGTGSTIFDNGTEVAVTLTTTPALYTDIVDSVSYPTNAAAIGMRSEGGAADTFFYEGGIIISYLDIPTGFASWASQPISQPIPPTAVIPF